MRLISRGVAGTWGTSNGYSRTGKRTQMKAGLEAGGGVVITEPRVGRSVERSPGPRAVAFATGISPVRSKPHRERTEGINPSSSVSFLPASVLHILNPTQKPAGNAAHGCSPQSYLLGGGLRAPWNNKEKYIAQGLKRSTDPNCLKSVS